MRALAAAISGTGGALLVLACLLGTGWILAARAGLRSAAERVAAALTIAAAIAYLLFVALAEIGHFGPVAGVAAAAALAIAAHLARPRGRSLALLLADDWGRAKARVLDAARTPAGLAAAACGAWMLARVLRGLVAPPLAWDALTYHLFRAGQWAQTGSAVLRPGPDSWGYYTHFPKAGDVVWAWAFLFAPDGALLAPVGLLVWVALLPATYAAARLVGADPRHAVFAAAAVAFAPPTACALTASYVDITALALFVLGVVFVLRCLRDATAPVAVLAGLALGLAVAVRSSLGVVTAVAVALVAARVGLVPGGSRSSRLAPVWIAATAFGLFVAEYARTWITRGSPFYPLALRLGGREILPGNPQLMDVLTMRGDYLDPAFEIRFRFLERFFWPFSREPHFDYLGFGPSALIVLALAAIGGFLLWKRRSSRAGLLFAIVAAAAIVLQFLAPEAAALRRLWFDTSARFLSPSFAAAAIVAAAVGGRAAGIAWAVVLALDALLIVPSGFTPIDLEAIGRLAPWVAAGLVAAAAAVVGLRRRVALPIVAALAAVAVIVPTAYGQSRLRPHYRYRIWKEAAADPPSFDLHRIFPEYVAWPIWQRLDGAAPRRIAVIAGWELAQNWFLYPLLGSHLQNHVAYVPPSRDGVVRDYRDAAALAAVVDFESWVARLEEEAIDTVVVLEPPPPERFAWIERAPELFEPMGDLPPGPGRVYRFRATRRNDAPSNR